MGLYSDDVRVSDNATADTYVVKDFKPNVSQYGWTKEESAYYNQMIQYLNEVRKIQEYVASVAENLDGLDQDVAEAKRALADAQALFTEMNNSIEKFEETLMVYNHILQLFAQKYEDFISKYEDFLFKYNDIEQFVISAEAFALEASNHADRAAGEVVKAEGKVQDAAAQVVLAEGKVQDAAAQVTLAEAKVAETQVLYNMSKDLYDALKEGQVYRGTWDPVIAAYPPHQGTNSVWDVVIASGSSVNFDGKTWRNGDRLLYSVDESKYFHVPTSTGVTSVNGGTGAVTITAASLGAFPAAGGTITGITTINTNTPSPLVLSRATQVGIAFDNKTSGTYYLGVDDEGALKYGANASHALNSKVYHAGNKPTTTELGAMSLTGTNTATGLTEFRNDSGMNVKNAAGTYGARFISSGTTVFMQGGKVDGAESDQKLNLTGYVAKPLTALSFKMANGINPTIQWDSNYYSLYHSGNKPTAAELGVPSLTSANVYTGSQEINGALTIKNPSTHLFFTETDTSDKQWHVEVNAGKFQVAETGVAQRIVANAGGGGVLSGAWNATGNLSSSGQILEQGSRVYSPGNPPTAAAIGAAPAGFGLGGVGASLSGKSCDDATESGFYGIYSGTTETPFGTGPSGSTLVVSKWGTNGVMQMFYSYTSDRVFCRRLYTGVWQSWFEIYTTAKKPTPADIGAMAENNGVFTRDIEIRGTSQGPLKIRASSTTPNEVRMLGLKSDGGQSWYVGNTEATGDNIALYSNVHGNGLVLSANYADFNKTIRSHATGNFVESQGGMLRSDTTQVMSMDGKVYSFVTAPMQSHLCANSYWNGTTWKKYDNSKASETLVIGSGQFQYVTSAAGSTNPMATRYNIYHEGNKPSAAEIGAMDISVYKPRTNALSNYERHIAAIDGVNMDSLAAGDYGLYNGGTCANSPWTSYFYCETKSIYSTGARLQTAWPYDNQGGVFIRNYSMNTSSWGAWKQVYTYGDRIVASSATSSDYNGAAIEVTGNGAANTIAPSIGFHQPSLYAGSLSMIDGNQFGFYKQGRASYATIVGDGGNFADVYIRSDIRYKSDFKPIENALEKVNTLTGQTYLKNEVREAGVIAQEVQKVLPEAVIENTDDGMLSVKPASMIALLLESIKELSAKVDTLTARVEELENGKH